MDFRDTRDVDCPALVGRFRSIVGYNNLIVGGINLHVWHSWVGGETRNNVKEWRISLQPLFGQITRGEIEPIIGQLLKLRKFQNSSFWG